MQPTCSQQEATCADKSNDEIFYQDFKLFNSGKTSYGVGQISSLNADELVELKERLLPF